MTRLRDDAVAQAFTLLRIGFFVLPVLMGVDKFAEVLNENWSAYLASEFNDILPGNAQDAMYARSWPASSSSSCRGLAGYSSPAGSAASS
jgi:hypothetical protein